MNNPIVINRNFPHMLGERTGRTWNCGPLTMCEVDFGPNAPEDWARVPVWLPSDCLSSPDAAGILNLRFTADL